ncbi:hypothetical protein RB195_022142 [Necator americanus]|uniref:Integrase catalytic domain-containing protein n=1 Tax=Necator americanus TaxID=51031 RepID=A0ABR1EE33_NECAM
MYVDLTGSLHLTESGNKYIIALIDHFTKFVIAVPLPDFSAVTVAHAIMTKCILKFGVMTQLVSDNASYFKGEVVFEIGSFQPPGLSKPWTAASISHDDTSLASSSEASLAFGSSSQSLRNEAPSSHKRHGRDRRCGVAMRLGRREQSLALDEKPIAGPARIPSETVIGFHLCLKYLHPWAKSVNPSPVRVLRSPFYRSVEKTPSGRHDNVTLPPTVDRIRPVLHQVVSTGWGSGVILEAKDFFNVGLDHRDLYCVILDQHAVNVVSSYRGFDKSMVSVKEYVWVYDVKPSRQALANPSAVPAQSRIPRITALEKKSTYFFKAARFVFASPDTPHELVYGLVLGLVRRSDTSGDIPLGSIRRRAGRSSPHAYYLRFSS